MMEHLYHSKHKMTIAYSIDSTECLSNLINNQVTSDDRMERDTFIIEPMSLN
jgi:hypothetical protein